MKNASGAIGGFIFGMIGFLGLFKLIILDKIPPSDELAPGIVVIASIFSGMLGALIGRAIQHRLGNRSTFTESE